MITFTQRHCNLMPFTFELKSQPKLPLDVRELNPDRLMDLSIQEVRELEIGIGNRKCVVSDWFSVSGEASNEEVVFEGALDRVHAIGHALSSGKVVVNGSAGRHLGASMSAGEIVVRGDVGDFVGYEMTGGTIVVHGNAGDHVGGCYPGAKFGMNRGTILIAGSAGKGLGFRMRRGTIVVGGNVEEHAGWQMRAGTIAVFGECDGSPGIDMKRGTIFVGSLQDVSCSFVESANTCSNVAGYLNRWLKGAAAKYELAFPELKLSDEPKAWCGDILTGNRGELVEFG